MNTHQSLSKHEQTTSAIDNRIARFALFMILASCSGDEEPVKPTPTPAKINTATIQTTPQGGIIEDTDYVITSISTNDEDGFEAAKVYLMNDDQNLGQVDAIASGEKNPTIKIPATTFPKGKKSPEYSIHIEGNSNTKRIPIPLTEREVPGGDDTPIETHNIER